MLGLVVAAEIELMMYAKKIRKMIKRVTNVPKTEAKKNFQNGFMGKNFLRFYRTKLNFLVNVEMNNIVGT
jgi:hypothetical protein